MDQLPHLEPIRLWDERIKRKRSHDTNDDAETRRKTALVQQADLQKWLEQVTAPSPPFSETDDPPQLSLAEVTLKAQADISNNGTLNASTMEDMVRRYTRYVQCTAATSGFLL